MIASKRIGDPKDSRGQGGRGSSEMKISYKAWKLGIWED